MKRTVTLSMIFMVLLLIMPSLIYAQDDLKTIEVKDSFWGAQYICDGNRISITQLQTLLGEVAETQEEVKKAKSYSFRTNLFSGIGGFCIGYPIGTAIGGGNPELSLLLVGGISTRIGLRYQRKMDQHYKSAIEIYNSKISNQN